MGNIAESVEGRIPCEEGLYGLTETLCHCGQLSDHPIGSHQIKACARWTENGEILSGMLLEGTMAGGCPDMIKLIISLLICPINCPEKYKM